MYYVSYYWLVYRFETPKDAEVWCSIQSANIIANALLATPLAMVQCEGRYYSNKFSGFCSVEYIFNQLPAESQLSTLWSYIEKLLK